MPDTSQGSAATGFIGPDGVWYTCGTCGVRWQGVHECPSAPRSTSAPLDGFAGLPYSQQPRTPGTGVLSPHARGYGKNNAGRRALVEAIKRDEHAHRVSLDGVECFNGTDECSIWRDQGRLDAAL